MAVKGKTEGLSSDVLRRLEEVSRNTGRDVTVSSGREDRNGTSAHNRGLAADIAIPGYNTKKIAEELRKAGFTGIGEYYNKDGSSANFGHGDIRGLSGSEDTVYGPGKEHGKPVRWVGFDKGKGPGQRKWKYDVVPPDREPTKKINFNPSKYIAVPINPNEQRLGFRGIKSS